MSSHQEPAADVPGIASTAPETRFTLSTSATVDPARYQDITNDEARQSDEGRTMKKHQFAPFKKSSKDEAKEKMRKEARAIEENRKAQEFAAAKMMNGEAPETDEGDTTEKRRLAPLKKSSKDEAKAKMRQDARAIEEKRKEQEFAALMKEREEAYGKKGLPEDDDEEATKGLASEGDEALKKEQSAEPKKEEHFYVDNHAADAPGTTSHLPTSASVDPARYHDMNNDEARKSEDGQETEKRKFAPVKMSRKAATREKMMQDAHEIEEQRKAKAFAALLKELEEAYRTSLQESYSYGNDNKQGADTTNGGASGPDPAVYEAQSLEEMKEQQSHVDNPHEGGYVSEETKEPAEELDDALFDQQPDVQYQQKRSGGNDRMDPDPTCPGVGENSSGDNEDPVIPNPLLPMDRSAVIMIYT
jgi:hypothetical protein